MALGKARFLVTRMFEFQHTSFKVKSGTFVAGVRGSDFIIARTEETTSVTALEKTTLEVLRMDAPEMKPVLLSSFQRTVGSLDGGLQKPQNIPPQEIELLKQEFNLNIDPGSSSDSEAGKTDPSKSNAAGKKEEDTKQSGENRDSGSGETSDTGKRCFRGSCRDRPP
ncbi:MAG: hypothetical protein C4522_00460 [Desulfobacteraceae bacterium]|nr:MAG: hypothetical protein C4522_00460 [Desulfobacteraceae bacterium]